VSKTLIVFQEFVNLAHVRVTQQIKTALGMVIACLGIFVTPLQNAKPLLHSRAYYDENIRSPVEMITNARIIAYAI